MKFSCDSCGAQYMIADTKIGPKGVKVKCKKCAHVIVLRVGKKDQDDTKDDAPEPKAAPAKTSIDEDEFTVSLNAGASPAPSTPAPANPTSGALLSELGTSSDFGLSTEFRAAGFGDQDGALPRTARLPTIEKSPFEGGASGGSLGGRTAENDAFGQAGMFSRSSEEEPATRVEMDSRSESEDDEAPLGKAGTSQSFEEDPSTNVAPAPSGLGAFGDGLTGEGPGTSRERGPSNVGFDAGSESTVNADEPSSLAALAGSVNDSEPHHAMGSPHELESELGSAFDAVFGGPGADEQPSLGADPFSAMGGDPGVPSDKLPTRVLDPGAVDSYAIGSKDQAESTVAVADQAEWFVAINEEQVGPLSFQEVQAHWDRGNVTLDSLCWKAGMADWVQVRFVPELEALGPKEAPKAPAPIRSESPAPFKSAAVAPLRQDTPEPETRSAVSLGRRNEASESAALSRSAWKDAEDSPTRELEGRDNLGETSPLDDSAPTGRPKLEIVPSIPPPKSEPLGSITSGGLLGVPNPAAGAIPEHPGEDEPSWKPSAASALAALAAGELSESKKSTPASTLPPPSDALSSLLSEPSMVGLKPYQSEDSSVSLSPLPKAAPDVAAVAASRPTVGRGPNWVLIGLAGMGLVILVLVGVLIFKPSPEPPKPPPTEVAQVTPPPQPAQGVPPPPVATPDAGVAPDATTEAATEEPPLPADPEDLPAHSKATKKKDPEKQPKKVAPKKPDEEEEEEDPPPKKVTPPPPEPDVDSLDPDALLEGASRRTKQRPTLPDEPDVKDQLGDDDILRELRKHKDEIRDCIDKQKRSDPSLSGKMQVKFVLLNSGRTSEHSVTPVKFEGSTVGRCVVDSVRKWRFPKFSGKPMPIDFPVNL